MHKDRENKNHITAQSISRPVICRPEFAWSSYMHILAKMHSLRNPKFEIQNTKYEIQNPKSRIQNAKPKLQNQKPKIQNSKFEIQNPISETQNPEFKIQNPKSNIRKSRIQNPKSVIQNTKSKIQTTKSKIRNPNSETQNPKSNGFLFGAGKQKTETPYGDGEFPLQFIFLSQYVTVLHLLLELADSKTKMDTIVALSHIGCLLLLM